MVSRAREGSREQAPGRNSFLRRARELPIRQPSRKLTHTKLWAGTWLGLGVGDSNQCCWRLMVLYVGPPNTNKATIYLKSDRLTHLDNIWTCIRHSRYDEQQRLGTGHDRQTLGGSRLAPSGGWTGSRLFEARSPSPGSTLASPGPPSVNDPRRTRTLHRNHSGAAVQHGPPAYPAPSGRLYTRREKLQAQSMTS